jgi:micrococcal nuclease
VLRVRQRAVLAVALGTACATYSSAQSCDLSYPDVCIPLPPPDLDCADVSVSNFRVIGSDPHGFDGDYDGIGCEE